MDLASVAVRPRLPAGPRLGLAAFQIVPQGGRQAGPMAFAGPLARSVHPWTKSSAFLACWRTWRTPGRPLATLGAELADAASQVNRAAARCSGSAACVPGVHQALKGADILAMAPPALETVPPTPHGDDHEHSPQCRIGARRPRFLARWLPTRHDRTMAELWKIDESGRKVGVFPGLALAGPKWHCPRRFPGATICPPASGAAVAQW